MGGQDIKLGRAYVELYGDDKMLVQSVKKLDPVLKQQVESLSRVANNVGATFSRSTSEILRTTDQANDAARSLNDAASASTRFGSRSQTAMNDAVAASRAAAEATRAIVEQMKRGAPISKGFAAGLSSLTGGGTSIAGGAFGISSMITLLKAGGPATKPFHDALTGIVGKAQQLEKVRPKILDKAAVAKIGDGSGLPVETPKAPGKTISQIKDELKQTYSRVYSLIKSRGIESTGQSNGSKTYDQEAVGQISKAIADIDKKKSVSGSGQRTSVQVLVRLHDKIRQVATGATANSLGGQSIYEGITAGARAATAAVSAAGKAAAGGIKTAYQAATSEQAKFIAGAAAGGVAGAAKGTARVGRTLAAVGSLGASEYLFGPRSAAQQVAVNAQRAAMFGSKEQRQAANEMRKQADAAAVGEAFSRSVFAGMGKYISVGSGRFVRALSTGLARAPITVPAFLLRVGLGFRKSGADATAAEGRFQSVRNAMNGIGRTAQSISGKVGGFLGGALAGAAALRAFGGRGASSAGSRMIDLGASAAKNKRSVESTSELDFAANMTGTNLKTLDSGLENFNSLVKEAANGGQTAATKLAQLGLSADKLGTVSTDEKLSMIGKSLAKIKDPLERDRIAMELMGDSAHELTRMLTNLDELRGTARSSGAVVSQKDVQAAKDMKAAFASLKGVLTNAFNSIGSNSVRTTTMWVQGAVRIIQNNQRLIGTVIRIGAAVAGIAGGIGLFATFIGPLMPMIAGVGTALAALMNPIGLILGLLAGGMGVWAYFTESGRTAVEYLGTVFTSLRSIFTDTWGGIVAAIMSGDLTLAGKIAFAGLKLGLFTVLKAMGVSWKTLMTFFYSAAFIASATITNAWASIAKAFRTVQNVLAKSMVDITSTIISLWFQVFTYLRSGWNAASNWIAAQMIKVMGKLTGKSKVQIEQELKSLKEDGEAQEKEIQQQKKNALDKLIPQSTKDTWKELDSMKNQDVAQIEAERNKSMQGKEDTLSNQLAGLGSDSQTETQMKQELAGLIKKAKTQPTNTTTPAPPKFEPMKVAATAGTAKESVAGTFNAMAAGGLGGGALDKIAENTSQTAKSLKKIEEKKWVPVTGNRRGFSTGFGV